ncbi:hypothetical protein [Streptococcus fryi]
MFENKMFLKVINVICIGLGSLLLFWSSVQFGASSKGGLVNFLLALLVFYIILYVSLLLHELGHVFFGWLSGYQLVAFGVLKWNLVFTGEGIRLVKKQSLMGVGAQYFGVKKSGTVRGDLLMLSGGLIVHLLLGLLGLIIGLVTQDWGVPLANLSMQMGMIILNSNPNGITDGAKILELWLYPSHAAYMYVELERSAVFFNTPVQGNLTDFVQDIPLEYGGIAQASYLNAADAKLIEGDYQKASEKMEALYTFTENPIIKMATGASLILAYLLQGDTSSAETIYQNKAVQKMLQQPQAQMQVVKAYYTKEILQDGVAAEKLLTKAEKAMATSYLLCDEKAFYDQLISRLRGAIKEESIV